MKTNLPTAQLGDETYLPTTWLVDESIHAQLAGEQTLPTSWQGDENIPAYEMTRRLKHTCPPPDLESKTNLPITWLDEYKPAHHI